jgi:hypothetical protein
MEMCHLNKSLNAPVLNDVPHLDEKQIASFLDVFAAENTKLQHFHLTAPDTGQLAGEAVANLILCNQSITSLNLILGDEWPSCGTSMARVLAANSTLNRFRLGFSGSGPEGNDVVASAIKIAEALQSNNSQLTHLSLLVDLEALYLDGWDKDLVEAFDLLLEENHVLEELVIP